MSEYGTGYGRGNGDGTEGPSVRFTLDGEEIEARAGETILRAAERKGVAIPHLCYTEGMRVDGNCRACVVEIEGERVLAPSCYRTPSDGMVVHTKTERARASQKMVLELLETDTPEAAYRTDSELAEWVDRLGVTSGRLPARAQPEADRSHPAMTVRLAACIQCTRCVRACREVQVNDVIGYAHRGADAKIVFDFDDPMGRSTCVACGECVQACPTGALMPKSLAETDATLFPVLDTYAPPEPETVGRDAAPNGTGGNGAGGVNSVPSLCPYCGVGCQVTYHERDGVITHTTGRDGPANRGRLCVKGRFGFDYVHNDQRLTKPLIRKDGVEKAPDGIIDPRDWSEVFREASWEEALNTAAAGLRNVLDEHGGGALAGFGSAKGSNEEAYLFQKLIRAGFGTNNVDHCTRLCHASSVAALLEMIGSGAVSNPFADVQFADVFIVIGANPTVNHPVAATFMKNAIERGAKFILIDPRATDMARLATHSFQFNPGTDVALLNAMLHTIVTEGLVDRDFIDTRTDGWAGYEKSLTAYSPEAMQEICGIPADEIRAAARLYATADNAMIFWGMGIAQHTHGTDNARCLINLALTTGQIGRRGAGLHPLRGQNNVQGASDMGLIPMVYPDYQNVDSAEVREWFQEFWDAELDPEPGLTVVEIMNAVLEREIRGMYIMGENPAMSDPDLGHVREALAAMDWLVVQEIFLTETASFADVILPASAFPEKTGTFTNSDRRVQLGRQVLDPPGDARQDLWITQELGRRIGMDWHYDGPADVFEEIRQCTASMAGITWDRLELEHAVTYPCREVGDPGTEVLFDESFPTENGLGHLKVVDYTEAAELPDDDFPNVLITGRILEHWHTGAMTRRAEVLDAIEPVPMVSVNPRDLEHWGVEPGQPVTLETRRGSVVALTRHDPALPEGAVFLPFCYTEAPANLMTNPELDPDGKIPEFKYCAVRVTPGGEVEPAAFAASTDGATG
ncbi:MAG: formate dehydrogenase subunit alpha [Candidatus Longimicrobiales bacterium M2_2A_002]